MPSSVSMSQSNWKKTPSFGFGTQASQERVKAWQRDMPSPNKYNLVSSFDENKMHYKGTSFGINHQYYRSVYNECLPEKKGWTEPGMYNIKSFVEINKDDGKKVTFKGRHERSP